ncbi:protein mono-ADP-ribosyltransferase PARP14 isoform X2 [Rhinatrema bivittatum]|uniref:protein mono-ADP-ribosyltransferase PARP14 isoform X2 n=1 Tax=Rhinatrema bivittatum TaxID=194408 RepID=UPI001126BC65|nr:protein mono-ADP-ribosyltransferase PARP14 isoform X2 [Rhinatrema bivittatum]
MRGASAVRRDRAGRGSVQTAAGAMEDGTYPYPLLVRGEWGDPVPRGLKNKLLLYFQSLKKSGGGDCAVGELSPQQALLCFAEEQVRQNVLDRHTHELPCSDKGSLKLEVTLPELPEEEKVFPENVEPATSDQQSPDAQEVLRKKDHVLKNATLHVRSFSEEIINEPQTPLSLSVVLENIQENATKELLSMLVENISSLEEDTFKIELIPEVNVAVVTFMTHNDATGFLAKCSLHPKIIQLKITARPLELTKSIRVENLPPDISEDYLTMYFESSKSGAGSVSDVTLLLDENSAIITFPDQKVISKVLSIQHLLKKRRISVYPYYSSLDTVLYGKERPVIKLPEPLSLDMDPYVCQYIQNSKKLIQDINNQMADCYCELKWPQPNCAHPVIHLSPSPSISKQRSLMAKLVKTWYEQVGTQFSSIISKYSTVEYQVNSVVWGAVKGKVYSALPERILVKPDIANKKVALAGLLEDVQGAKRKFSELIENAAKEIERESLSKKLMVSLSPATYAILHNQNLEKNLHDFFPNLKMSYDASSRHISLYGLPEEVFGAKSDILEREKNLKETTLHLDPHVFRLLQEVDNEEFSQTLFTDNKICAMYEIRGERVVLRGSSLEILSAAEKQLKRGVICKCINTEGSTATKKEEWKDLTSRLNKLFNSPTKTVRIDEGPIGLGNQIVVVGFCEAVNEVYQQVSDFIEKNTMIQEIIPAKSQAIVLFVKDEKAQRWTDIQRKNVKIIFNAENGQKHISLSGPRVDVLEVAQRVRTVLASLHADTLVIDKPGAKKFFIGMEDFYVPAAKKSYNCLLRLQKDGEEVGGSIDEDEGVNQGQPCCKVQLHGGVVIATYKDDLGQHQVDVVVNASNEDLKHIGGLAAALSQAAGPKLQKDCDHIIQTQGKLKPGEAVITEAGRLACKQVIHAVGPRWHEFNPARCEFLLKKAVKESLRLTELYNHQSVAIPAISSGIFGFPLKLCVDTIVISIKEYVERCEGKGILRQIHLVDNSEQTVQAFKTALEKVFAQQAVQVIVPDKPQPKPLTLAAGWDHNGSRKDLQKMKTKEGLSIVLDQGNIQDAKTDVIVNSIAKDLNLAQGAIAQALLQKAGPTLQQLLNKEGRGQSIAEGSVLRTDGCNLNCREVFHVICPGWNSGQGMSEKILRDIIKECLNVTEKLGFHSITFPAIGTGNLGFPKPLVATIIFDQIFKFSGKKDFKSLQEINILLHPSDTDSMKAFSSELRSKGSGKTTPEKPTRNTTPKQGPAFFGAISQGTLGVYEMQIGTITFQVKTGDITKENSDVIVNSSNDQFNLNSGVSKAILTAAGQTVVAECALLALQAQGEYIVTQQGNLMCKKIIHIKGKKDPAAIKVCVQDVLQECEQLACSSVAFPALGTGQGQADPSKVADAMIDAVADFANQNNPQVVKTIKIIIFQPQMVNSFYTSMQQKEGTDLPAPQTFINKVISLFSIQKSKPEKKTTLVLKRNIEPAVFQICGESRKAVEDTKKWIEDLILKEQHNSLITDDWIAEFEEQEHKRLDELQKKLQITIHVEYKPSASSVRVCGLTRDVLLACNEIQDMIKKVKDEDYKKREADLMSNLVEWQYLEGNKYVPFDSLINLALEKGFSEQSQSTVIDFKKGKYTVDFGGECATNQREKKITIKRVSKIEGAQLIDAPQHWDPVNITEVKEVPLTPGSSEYQTVEALFKQSCRNQILKIARIQNLTLWKTYQIKKQSIDAKNGNTNNERQLFHGTAPNTLQAINKYGFNRSYAGMNAAMYGNGTYFAVEARYSAANAYSKPDATGQKYMYLARVLVGECCVGQQNIVTPPSKSATDPTTLYDSVTDNPAKPSMFVIFNDIQAYPEYLITLK